MSHSRSRSRSRSRGRRSPSRSRSRSRSRGRSRSRSPAKRGGPPPHSDDLYSVLVSGFGSDIVEEDLKDKFGKYGEIGDCFIPLDRDTRRNRGFGFVRYYKQRDQEDCVDELKDKGINIRGSDVRVDFAKARPRPGRPGWRYSRSPPRRRGGGGRYSRDRDSGRRGYRSRSRDRRRSRSRSYDRRRR